MGPPAEEYFVEGKGPNALLRSFGPWPPGAAGSAAAAGA